MNWFRRPVLDETNLPPGDLGRRVIGNTFAFHNDAQALILDNMARYPGSPVYRAKVIGRDVGLVVDYKVAQGILTGGDRPVPSSLSSSSDDDSESGADDANYVQAQSWGSGHKEKYQNPRFSHREAYTELIGAFFAEPNILLEDPGESSQAANRQAWDQNMSEYLSEPNWTVAAETITEITRKYRDRWRDQDRFEVYKGCKDLAHELVFALFLGLEKDDEADEEDWSRALEMTDTSLRGQFSLPVRANLGGLVQSTYSRGLQAQEGFRDLIGERIQAGRCPFSSAQDDEGGGRSKRTGSAGISLESMMSHTAMFGSSLVVKAIASYLTFVLIHLSRPSSYDHPLKYILLETERLCPPIIGVLRRVLDQPFRIPLSSKGKGVGREYVEIPAGWDAWMYFPLINRDPSIYGSDASRFRPDRWAQRDLPQPMSFGQGGKTCLGVDMVRQIVLTVVQTLVSADLSSSGRGDGMSLILSSELESSVKDFLGWERGYGSGWPGIKQLPVQRPRDKVFLSFRRDR